MEKWLCCDLRASSLLQISHHEGYIASFPRDTVGTRGGPDEDGGQGGAEVEFQALVAWTEDRGACADAVEHRWRTADMSEGQGKVQGIRERNRVEDQAYGRHERDAVIR